MGLRESSPGQFPPALALVAAAVVVATENPQRLRTGERHNFFHLLCKPTIFRENLVNSPRPVFAVPSPT